MIISVLNIKGGVGKTTVTINLAVGLVEEGKSVCVIDCDPQGSSLRWNDTREASNIDVFKIDEPGALRKGAKSLAQKYDIIIIDGAPATDKTATTGAALADIVLLPLGPSPFDVWATESMIDRVAQVREVRPEIQVRYLINKHSKHTVLGKEVASAMQQMETPVMEASLATRIAYADAAAEGLSVLEWNDKKAIEEVQSLVSEVRGMMNG